MLDEQARLLPYDDGITCAHCGGQACINLGELSLCVRCVSEVVWVEGECE